MPTCGSTLSRRSCVPVVRDDDLLVGERPRPLRVPGGEARAGAASGRLSRDVRRRRCIPAHALQQRVAGPGGWRCGPVAETAHGVEARQTLYTPIIMRNRSPRRRG